MQRLCKLSTLTDLLQPWTCKHNTSVRHRAPAQPQTPQPNSTQLTRVVDIHPKVGPQLQLQLPNLLAAAGGTTHNTKNLQRLSFGTCQRHPLCKEGARLDQQMTMPRCSSCTQGAPCASTLPGTQGVTSVQSYTPAFQVQSQPHKLCPGWQQKNQHSTHAGIYSAIHPCPYYELNHSNPAHTQTDTNQQHGDQSAHAGTRSIGGSTLSTGGRGRPPPAVTIGCSSFGP